MCVLTVEGRVMNAQWFGKTIGIKLRTVLPQRAIVCSHSPTEVTCHPRTSVFNDEHVNFPDPDCLVRVHQMEVVSNLVQQVRTMDLGPNLNRTSRTTPGPRARRRAPRSDGDAWPGALGLAFADFLFAWFCPLVAKQVTKYEAGNRTIHACVGLVSVSHLNLGSTPEFNISI